MAEQREKLPLILASASPRRREILSRLGVEPDAIYSLDIDESPIKGELPRLYAARMAYEKAQAGLKKSHEFGDNALAQAVILAGDTVVACGRRILPKAEDEATARDCLALLSGRRHKVYSAVALAMADGKIHQKMAVNMVQMKRLSPKEIEQYIASNEWHGKAGGYAIQGLAESYIPMISGSHSAIMGLPLYETRLLLCHAGILD